jgi:hypothetical protein
MRRLQERAMVDDAEQRSAEELRDVAAKLRSLARQTRSVDGRDGLLDLARRFEEMAGRIDGHRPQASDD